MATVKMHIIDAGEVFKAHQRAAATPRPFDPTAVPGVTCPIRTDETYTLWPQWMEPHFPRRRVLPYPSRSRLHGSQNRLNFAAKRLWWVRVYGRQEERGQDTRYGFLYVDGLTGKAEAL